MVDRKRTHYDSSASYGPPPKKPNNTSESLQNEQGASSGGLSDYRAYTSINISEPEWLEKYPKDALFSAMREYKGQAIKYLDLNKELLEKDEEYKKKLILVYQLLEYLRKFLIRFYDEINPGNGISSTDVHFNGPYLNRTDDTLRENESLESTRRIVSAIVDKMTNWFRERDEFLKDMKNDDNDSCLAEIYYKEIEKFDNMYSEIIEKIESHENRFAEVHSLIRELEITRASLELTSRNLENTQDKLEQLEKNVDRSNIFVIDPFLHLGRKSDNKSGNSASKSMSEKLELIELRAIAESRVKELNDTQAEKVELRRKIHDLQEKIRCLPEERIKESELFRTLQLELDAINDSYAHLYALFEMKTREAQTLTASRDKSEMKRMDQEFQEVKKEYHNDLERIRAKRNELVKEVESLRTMIPQEFQKISSIRMLANDRMEIIHNLKEEVRRLYTRIAEIENNKNRKSLHLGEFQDNDLAKKAENVSTENQIKLDQKKLKTAYDLQYEKTQSSEIEMLFSQQKRRDDDTHISVFDTQDQRIEPLKQSLIKFQQKLTEKTDENLKIQNEITSMNIVVSQQHEQLGTQKNELNSTKSQLVGGQKLVHIDNEIKVEQKISEMLRNDRDANIKEYSQELRRRDEEKRVAEKKLRQIKDQLEVATKEAEELRSSAVSSDAQKLLEAYEIIAFLSACMHFASSVWTNKSRVETVNVLSVGSNSARRI
ncbi:4670_t:CDS:10 [Acaulospora colombiana]|uniref:4670_t:CDS:1 n=1 Tax=Acaulospora colombiana TaxID=27376 RepID=A0ACA9K8F5_9GLOM|nr:4670_t:CDS:10 [Acaulospora colombiana]